MIRSFFSWRTFFRIPYQSFKIHRTNIKSFIQNYRYLHTARSVSPPYQKVAGYSLATCFCIKQFLRTHNASCLQVHHHGNNHYESLRQVDQTSSNTSGQYKIARLFGLVYKYMRLLIRLVWACSLYGPLFTLYPLTTYIPSWRGTWLRTLLFLVEISGPTFIKLGQWASTRRDLFSADFCDTFAKLHTNAPSHSWTYTATRLEEVFGKEWREVFVTMDTVIHSGCIGQVGFICFII